MPILNNPRHERFAQGLAAGKSQTEAYEAAGYTKDRTAASRLSTNVNVQARVAELQQRSAAKAEITIDSLRDMLIEDRAMARALEQPSAAVAAVDKLARLYGFMVERKQEVPSADLTDDQLDKRIRSIANEIRAEEGVVEPAGGTAEAATTH